MKTLISTLALTAAIALPAAALAATPLAPQIAQPTVRATNVPAQSVAPTPKVAPSNVAMQTKSTPIPIGYGQQAADDREGLSRLQDQARQLGATQ